MDTEKIGIVILAAGGSTRFGSPKQLLKFQGKTFLRRTVDVALSQDGCKAVVVLGENSRQSIDEIDALPVEIAVNNDWQTGISSSIKLGLKTLLAAEPELSAAAFRLCDQPSPDRVAT